MKATKLTRDVYMFRGYKITKHTSDGLLPGHKWIWEIEDRNGDVVNHTPTLRLAEAIIEEEEEKERNLKENEDDKKGGIMYVAF